jgi:aldehyde dehydrogenase (NAD+)
MDIKSIVKHQREYFESGVTRPLSFRLESLRKLQKALRDNEALICEAMKADLNKTPFESYMTEIGMALDELRFHIKHLPGWVKTKTVKTPLVQFHAKSFVVPEPYGVALIMSPWNYPVQLCLEPLTGAISGGNCAVIKPSA